MKTHVIFGVSVLVLIIAFVFGSSYYKRKQAEKIGFMAQAGVNIEQIRQDMADAKPLNVRKTLGFFVNGKPLQTFGSKQLLQLIQSELDANYPG
jgi:predicted negative regulator of RcsB-dependent stress response